MDIELGIGFAFMGIVIVWMLWARLAIGIFYSSCIAIFTILFMFAIQFSPTRARMIKKFKIRILIKDQGGKPEEYEINDLNKLIGMNNTVDIRNMINDIEARKKDGASGEDHDNSHGDIDDKEGN